MVDKGNNSEGICYKKTIQYKTHTVGQWLPVYAGCLLQLRRYPTLAALVLILSHSSQPSLKPHQSERLNTHVYSINSTVEDNMANILYLAFTIFGRKW